ncbi:YdcF family protein [Mycobacterium sp. B14F4]|uniref:YdcF family protein n=1 Tax=Mycobacterium sp. B14F4 TaxID=3153565 RepID=UPI00325DAE8A
MAITAIVVTNALLCGVGYFVFNRAAVGPLRQADAILVLAGEHDGREEYGISLAQRGLAPTVVLSDPYPRDDSSMRSFCQGRYHRIEVICSRPPHTTTRGEAMMARDLTAERQWQRVVVVTWRFHIPRTRLIFSRCLPRSSEISYVAVPRRYEYSLAVWEFQYLYQYAALMKAVVTPSCA